MAEAKASADVISQLSPKNVFIADVDAGGFLEPRWIKIQLMEGTRPFWGSRKLRVAEC